MPLMTTHESECWERSLDVLRAANQALPTF
jgi:hypothetical protein